MHPEIRQTRASLPARLPPWHAVSIDKNASVAIVSCGSVRMAVVLHPTQRAAPPVMLGWQELRAMSAWAVTTLNTFKGQTSLIAVPVKPKQ